MGIARPAEGIKEGLICSSCQTPLKLVGDTLEI